MGLPGMVAQDFNPSTQEAKASDLHELEASMASSMSAKATFWNLFSKQINKKQKPQCANVAIFLSFYLIDYKKSILL